MIINYIKKYNSSKKYTKIVWKTAKQYNYNKYLDLMMHKII